MSKANTSQGQAKGIGVSCYKSGLRHNVAVKRRRTESGDKDSNLCKFIEEQVNRIIQEKAPTFVEKIANDIREMEDAGSMMNSEIGVLQEQNKELKLKLAVSEGRLARAEKIITDLQ